MAVDSSQFNLRWTNHSFNILQVFLEQLTSETLVDVTLSCQGQFLKAHKMVLSACSTYFQDLFNVHEARHPVIILNGIKFKDLKMVVDFMYRGETRVLESELSSLLAVAESLQVKGLSNVRDKCEKTEVQGEGVDLPEDQASSTFTKVTEDNYVSNYYPDASESDPLELPDQSAKSTKPPRKRKCTVESKKVSAKVPPAKVLTSTKTVTQNKSPSKKRKRTAIKDPLKNDIVKKLKEALSKESSLTAENHKSSNASSSQNDSEDENTDVLPFVQVALNESANDEDDDLATTIKVEPLFIRDIDDNDANWDDPTRLVIDLPPEDPDGKNDSAEGEGKGVPLPKLVPIKTSFVPKQLLKVRSVSDLSSTSLSSDPAKSSSDGTSTAAKKNSLAQPLICNERRGKGGKIPRPPNAFMIFANEWRRKLAMEHPMESNKQISVRLGLKWKTLTTDKKEIYFTASRRADEEHKKKYPNYFYSPKEARLRKSEMQARLLEKRKKNAETIDPMKFVNTFMSFSPSDNSNLLNSDMTVEEVTVKQEPMDDDSTQQNLEEEFFKMVEDGHVEAEIEEDNGEMDCATESQGTKEDQHQQK